MKLALNGATTMKASLVEDIRAASAARFDFLEIWASKLRRFLETATASELLKLFEEHKLKPYSINSIERITFRDEGAHAELLRECEEMCRIASVIKCPYMVVVPSPLPAGKNQDDVIDESARILAELGSMAEKYGVALAFEFLGQAGCSVQRLEQASEIIRRVDRENVGLVIDSFHFYAGGSSLESISALDIEKLFIFHINDAEDLPRTQLEDKHRLLPGLGILPLKEILGALRRAGYDRVVSVEIFRPEYWERDAGALARDAYAATEKVLAASAVN